LASSSFIARYDLRVFRREVAVGEVKRILRDDALRQGQDAHAGNSLGDGEERIPDRPGVDRAALEGRARIGGWQIDRRELVIADAGLLDRRDGQIVRARCLGEGDLLALELGERLDGRIRRQQDRGAGACGLLGCDIEQVGLGGLGEDRGSVAGRAIVDAADIERFQQRRPEL
jgi:hypothetical protein